ncbi:MAG TPA: hypothetical protein VH834_18725 [Solirubrobacteraceae bacterium]
MEPQKTEPGGEILFFVMGIVVYAVTVIIAGAALLPPTAGLAVAFTALIAGAIGVAVFITRFLGNSSH